MDKLFFEGQCSLSSIFFELIQVAIGTRDGLSRIPSESEWEELYDMADKQSLIGICFAGLLKLGANVDDGYLKIGMSEETFFNWIGTAAAIQQTNKKMNKRCVELQQKLAEDGFKSCILKGQGVATLYRSLIPRPLQKRGSQDNSNTSNHSNALNIVDSYKPMDLSLLRQSGDIDAWVDAPKEAVVSWAKNHGKTEHEGYLHIGCHIFEDTEVELHYRPTYMRSLRHNKRLQEFCESHKSDWTERNGMNVPSWNFDVVYQLSHIYRHLFGLGVGFRQLMDYYFLLVNANDRELTVNLPLILSRLGLLNFAGAVMYIMREVFCMEERFMICPVDEKRGRMLLRQVMQTGNFGKMDMEQKKARSTTAGSMKYKLSQWWNLVRFYPEETLSAPLWKMVRMIKK